MGRLYVVATPIGNLKDITLRAIDTLNEVDFIICEDTRKSKILLDTYQIRKEMISYNAHSETKKIPFIIEQLLQGKSIALISDAGTPCISDPGIRLVNEAIKRNIEIIGIPGANAATLALSISGIPTDSYVFEGFLPQKKGRQTKLKELSKEERTIVLYESVYRIEKLLKELSVYMPNRYIVVWRELTKMFEESWRGYPFEILNQFSLKTIKGEFVIIIAPKKWKENFR
ncbi:16S rRNA (cytidine(1402)-2'-O)-methyltransferase [Melioribacteraceae bacterium 4301-Me]|uniref:16S rRNA (cytidine(1402)-2'-O)-methyltransferase n=1 Tax=Pyranulibacter aquaticus TaxID=3163344 RepID=UPI00359547B3